MQEEGEQLRCRGQYWQMILLKVQRDTLIPLLIYNNFRENLEKKKNLKKYISFTNFFLSPLLRVKNKNKYIFV